MERTKVAVVDLKVKPKFSDSDLNVIQSLLRKHGKITIMSIDDDDMKFYIRGEENIDYDFLDQLKGLLKRQNIADFVLSANEYELVGQKYYADNNSG